MKKLMILGASYSVVPLIQAAKRLGLYTIAASIPGNYPGFDEADESCYVDITDPAAVTEAARSLAVDGIATCCMDVGLRAQGHACTALGLPGPSREAVEVCTNKFRMKQAFLAGGVNTAKYVQIHSEADLAPAMEQLRFPLIVKAVDQMGSRGIFRCDTPEEVLENYPKSMAASREDYCLLEEFIEGTLFGVEGMVQNGKSVFLLPDGTTAFQAATPTPVGHYAPAPELEGVEEEIRRQVERVIAALGFNNTPMNCDCIRRGDEIFLVESTARAGATCLPELVGSWFGINYYEAIVRLAMGEQVGSLFAHGHQCAVLTQTLMADRQGTVRSIGYAGAEPEGLLELSFNIEPGDTVQPYRNGRDRIGQVILTAPTLELCRRRLRQMESGIRLELEGDLPVCVTPVHFLQNTPQGNRIYCKREDLHPFSFGGNKVRFAKAYLADMERKGCDAMILYGGYSSNLCRILATACAGRGIPCAMVHNLDDGDPAPEAPNARIIRAAGVKEYPCHRTDIARAVQAAMDDFTAMGRRPYYIHGNIYGQGNAGVPIRAIEQLYAELLSQEQAMGIHFDWIFLASSTNTTQSGLLAEHWLSGDQRRIVGISVSRSAQRAAEVIRANLEDTLPGQITPQWAREEILVDDTALAGGYGKADEAVLSTIREQLMKNGLPLDPVYTGKAFCGMLRYLERHDIQNQNILFLHTGGTPLLFDALSNGMIR